MSTTDNIHKKVHSTNALKSNFISNTTQKLKDQEKRFSNISKEKEPLQEFRHTVHKKIARYYEQTDMQGSATIIPQKNSSRKNIYMNQNNNMPIQVPSNQRKQQLNLNFKAKSPLGKSRLNNINTAIPLSMINNNINAGISNVMVNEHNIGMMNHNMGVKMQQNIQYQPKPTNQINQIKNLPNNKTIEIFTEREKSYRYKKEQSLIYQNEQPSRYQKDQHSRNQKQQKKEGLIMKMKSMIMNERKYSQDFDDLRCDQIMEMALVPQKELSKKLSDHFTNKNQSKIKSHRDDYISDNLSEQNNRTEKKHPTEKATMILEKTRSEHTININQHDSATFLPKTMSQLIPSNQNNQTTQHQQLSSRQQPKYHLITVNYEEQLRRFHQVQSELVMAAQIQTIVRLESRQKDYIVQPNYIELRQKNFNWFMRAVLMDWMMHVCFQFGLKRETFYIAVALTDKYLQITTDLPKSDFQLVGAATMFIAAKLEQFEALSSADFSKSTDNRYSPIEIRQTELKICRCMNYELNPPTMYMWANRFMAHWDSYIDMTNAKFHPYFQTHQLKYFKKEAEESYLLFRQMMQFMDCSILDVQTLQFSPKILVCSFMYLVLGKNYKEWTAKRIVEEFPRTSHYLVQEEEVSSFNHLFHMFLSESFELDIVELLPAVQYCSTYFTLILNFDAPSVAQSEAQQSLEQYESFQTYNGKMIDLIKKRYRGVYP